MKRLGGDLVALWGEAASVIWLRSQRIMQGGPEAAAEASLMVTEKIAAQQDLIVKLATGKLGKTPLAVAANSTRYMLKGVRANRKRLSGRR